MTKARPAVVLLALMMLWGCGPYRPKADPDYIQRSEKIILKDWKVRRYLRLVRHHNERLPTGSLKVQVVMANGKNRDLHCDVRVEFHDNNGIVKEPGTWQPTLFQRNSETTIAATSIGSDAADYRVIIRLQE